MARTETMMVYPSNPAAAPVGARQPASTRAMLRSPI